MTVAAAILSLSLIASILLPAKASLAQENQGAREPNSQQNTGVSQTIGKASHQKAQVGAGTDDETTTGSSGPGKSSGKMPPPPQASLCDSYKGPARQDCLTTVLRSAPKPNGG